MAEIIRVEERVLYVNDLRLDADEVAHIRDLLRAEPAGDKWADLYEVFDGLAD